MSLELIGAYTLAFAVDALVSAAFLWLGMKIVARFVGMPPGGVYCGYRELLVAVVAASGVSLIPKIGWVASIAVLFYLLKRFTSAGFGEILSMVLISRVVAILVLIPLLP